jgi:hypothetical protein
MYAATIMWVVITGVDGFSIAAIGSISTSRPPESTNPCGVCIQAFAVTTNHALAAPEIAIGTPDHQCCHGVSRSQP